MKKALICIQEHNGIPVGTILDFLDEAAQEAYENWPQDLRDHVEMLDIPENLQNEPEEDLKTEISNEQFAIVKKTVNELRMIKMGKLLGERAFLLYEADVEINKKVDAGQDASAWRTYRQALRDVTEPYKNEDGSLKEIVDNLEILDYPAKP